MSNRAEISPLNEGMFSEELTKRISEIFATLEIKDRTICPPSEELIEQLNKIAAKPPFCYIYKGKDNFIL